ncbi:MAG: TRAP transporter substrate-binding protein [Rhodobacteraceae bacterium]|nr:TRAP transporter substrate-binding protein [Paracoccaceae bacterium]
MTKRRTLCGLMGGAALGALTLGLGTSAALAQDVTLRLHHFLAAQANVPTHILDVWADRVEADSAGRIKVDRFPAMQLGGTPGELYDQAVSGTADVIWTVVGLTPGRFPSTEVFELPFMVSDARAASYAYWHMFEETMQEEFSETKILATWVHGPGVIHTEDAVNSPDDLRGMQIRGPSRLTVQLLEALGATPVGMPIAQSPEALSRGVINGAIMPWEVTPSLRIPELVENHTEFEGDMLYTVTFVLAMNQEKYDSLPDDLKAVIDDNSGLEFSIFAGGTQQDWDAPGREMAEELGNNIITVSGDAVDEWRARAEPIQARWVDEVTGRGIDGQALIDRARALMAEYEAAN